jgi:hypothetical protein
MLETIVKFDLVNMAKINRDGPVTSIGLEKSLQHKSLMQMDRMR